MNKHINFFTIRSFSVNIRCFKNLDVYKRQIHRSLNKKTPQDRFFEESSLIQRYDDEKIDKIFLIEKERKVSNDNVIMIDQKEYEVNYRYAGQKLL